MKRLQLSLVMLLSVISIVAQNNVFDTLDKPMRRFAEGCVSLSKGVAEKNELLVGMAADMLDPEIKGDNPIKIGKWALKSVDVSNGTTPDGSFCFSSDFARKWVDTNGVGPFEEVPDNLRKGTDNTCLIYTIGIAPHSAVVMKDRQSGPCQVVAVAQPGGKVNMTVSYGDESLKATPCEDGLVAVATWNMPTSRIANFTIENPTDNVATIILICN